MNEIEGYCDPAFERVRDVFAEHFERHPTGGPPELGAAVSVVVDGRTVVDLWGGFADRARTQRWQRDTVVMVASCTKGLTATVVSQLVERGALSLDEPVARHWPEYGRHGKEATTLRHLLTHQAGQPSLSADLGPGGVWDWDRVVRAFADAEPQWAPGSAFGYHALSFGHLLGELVRRASGHSVGELLRRDVSTPLGVDMLLGMDRSDLDRCAELVPPPEHSPFAALGSAGQGEDLATISRYSDPRLFGAPVANSWLWRSAGWPSAGAYANARALACVYGALANGGELGGVRLLSPSVLGEATREQVAGVDSVLRHPIRYGLGFQLQLPALAGSSERSPGSDLHPGLEPHHGFGHAGGWGALGWADPELRLGFGYTLNQTWALFGDPRGIRLYAAARACG